MGSLAIGQTRDDLLGVLGMPTAVSATAWSQGTSTVQLDASGPITGFTPGNVDLPLGAR